MPPSRPWPARTRRGSRGACPRPDQRGEAQLAGRCPWRAACRLPAATVGTPRRRNGARRPWCHVADRATGARQARRRDGAGCLPAVRCCPRLGPAGRSRPARAAAAGVLGHGSLRRVRDAETRNTGTPGTQEHRSGNVRTRSATRAASADDELAWAPVPSGLPPIELASIAPAPLVAAPVAPLEDIALAEIPLAPIVIAPLDDQERP